jgi:hypothetical protein
MKRHFVVALALITFMTMAAADRMLAAPSAASAAVPNREFITGQAGTLPKDPKELARTYFNQPAVRRLIYALEKGPLAQREAENMLGAGPTVLSDLIRVKLMRTESGEVRLAFAYFTAADMRRIHAVAAQYVPSLVAAFRAKAGEYAALWAQYPVASVSRDLLAFNLIAGIGLNWEGLDVLAAGGWRKPVLVSGPGWRYSFFASEDVPGYAYRGYYWGSSAFPADLPNISPPMPLAFVSFGDPTSDPRMNLPDLLGLPASQMTPSVRAAAEYLGFHDDALTGPATLGVDAGRQVGRLLLALRGRRSTSAELQSSLPEDPVAAELYLLQRIGYARLSSDGNFELTVPVFGDQDQIMLAGVCALNERVIRQWLAGNYVPIRSQLAQLTALRQGVSYEALFTQIWHEIFGLATRELVAEHLVADPYALTNPSPGSLSMAWRPDLLQHEWR